MHKQGHPFQSRISQLVRSGGAPALGGGVQEWVW